MRAIAKHWVNYNGTWHPAGEAFDIEPADAEQMKAYAEILPKEAKPEEPAQSAPAADETVAKRGRKRKNEQ